MSPDPGSDQPGDGLLTDEWQRAIRAEAGTGFDLSVCLTEPIHLLGGIQSYGALLAVDGRGEIEVASANTAEVLGTAPEALLGTPLVTLLGEEGVAAVHATLDAPTGDRGLCGLAVPADGPDFDVTVYRADGRVVLEFEPRPAERTFHFSRFYPRVRAALTRLQHGQTVLAVCQAAVAEIRALTGYDRVVAYRFEGAAGPGEVIAESVAEGLEPWVGLWFPATDIPPQARRLYERNWIRVIQDVDDATARLLPEALPGGSTPLDLSNSTLRTVSSFHLEYLRNIGVASSMSVSLLHSGSLWGLIACHGLAPRKLDAEVRSACEFFGVTLSLQLAALEEAQTSQARHQARTALSRLVTDLDSDIAQSVMASADLLGELVQSDAVVLRLGGQTRVVPGSAEEGLAAGLPELWASLPALGAGEVWHRDHLASHHPPLAGYAAELSGVLVLALDDRGEDLIAWTRRERRADRTWATDPARPVQLGERGQRLTPRGSSAVYQAVVSGHCVPWTGSDEAVAGELGRAVTTMALRHSARLTMLNDELRRANRDLDTFAHAAAHELKEPLRGIANTSVFISEDAEGTLDATTTRRLATISRLAQRMDELINSLLHFAQVGQAELNRREVDLREVTTAALEIAGPRLAEQQVAVTLPAPGAVLSADPDRLQEVLINLLVNAAKYARAEHPRTVAVELAADPGGVPAVLVRDNGIGIPEPQRRDVLRLFRRLHARDSYGGGHGAGLAIVERIVERHGGRLRLEATPGGGTTVVCTFEAG
ncbi:light-regulated signal transduction histidine kinase (bacteriophytochrome) [Crossiella equi]|uniref:Sensor-like histidine kinase SenX3 n=1 Tax=Crossiella equi TaxID=130796 RepID=A0ABS5A7E3_9PSEU|nr:ATP-binding protein [Crossiella equi]MBP2472157.1 light-regulated signal transduction histidine kinase (bacteriophytochrome) [Crossiella equi]